MPAHVLRQAHHERADDLSCVGPLNWFDGLTTSGREAIVIPSAAQRQRSGVEESKAYRLRGGPSPAGESVSAWGRLAQTTVLDFSAAVEMTGRERAGRTEEGRPLTLRRPLLRRQESKSGQAIGDGFLLPQEWTVVAGGPPPTPARAPIAAAAGSPPACPRATRPAAPRQAPRRAPARS